MHDFSPELIHLKDATHEFVEREVVPVAQKLHMAGQEIPDELLQKMVDMGFFGLLASREYGGLELGALAVVLVTEELSRRWFSVGALPSRNWGLCLSLEKFGKPSQNEKWLPKLIAGEW